VPQALLAFTTPGSRAGNSTMQPLLMGVQDALPDATREKQLLRATAHQARHSTKQDDVALSTHNT